MTPRASTPETFATRLTVGLDQIEHRLPELPARSMRLARAVTGRVVGATADLTATAAGRLGRSVGSVTGAAKEAASTTVGQTRNSIGRTVAAAQRGEREAMGQATAQAARTGRTVRDETSRLLGDATRAAGSTPDGKAALRELSKADLYEQAQMLDIDGRSNMTKQELVDVVSRG